MFWVRHTGVGGGSKQWLFSKPAVEANLPKKHKKMSCCCRFYGFQAPHMLSMDAAWCSTTSSYTKPWAVSKDCDPHRDLLPFCFHVPLSLISLSFQPSFLRMGPPSGVVEAGLKRDAMCDFVWGSPNSMGTYWTRQGLSCGFTTCFSFWIQFFM